MKTLKIILIVIGALLIILTLYLWSQGMFACLTAVERTEGGFKVAGMEYTGSYQKAGKFMVDVDNKLKEAGITCTRGFGIYYDDPKTTPAEKCRSFVGNIIEEKDWVRMTELQSKGFRVDSVPAAAAVVVEFPVKSTLSYMIGPMKAYPVLSKYMKEKGYTGTMPLEVYDVAQKKIFYIMQYKNNQGHE